jgi:hypothetical protein
MATLASLTLDVEEMLLGVAQIERPWEDSLSTQVTDAADTTWRFTSYSGWKLNDYCEVLDTTGAADEIVILAADATAGDTTVRRAQRGSTVHTGAIAAATGIRKNPAYPRVTIARFINDCVDTMLWPHVWYRTQRSLTYDEDAGYYTLAAADFDVEEMFQLDLSGKTLGTASFANATDRWTLAAHGLIVGDHVRFTSKGGSATPAEYDIDTDYWVLTVPSTSTFTLGLTADASTPVNGLADSTANWTVERRLPSYHPFPRGWWATQTDSPARSTDRILRVFRCYTPDETIYYTTKTKPLSSAISSIPDQLAAAVPWGACALLLGGTRAAPMRTDPKRMPPNDAFPAGQFVADSRYFLAMFSELISTYRKGLLKEKQPSPRWVSLLGVRRG